MSPPILPTDVWYHIADFLSPRTIQDLWNLNRVFFSLAMDIRYQQISFSYLSKRLIRTLGRLKDPEVRKRVRILHIHPHFLKEALEKENNGGSSNVNTLFAKIAGQLREICHTGKRLKVKTSQDLIQVMIQVLSTLPNLREYHVAWSGLPTLPNSMPTPLLNAPLLPSLKRLSLDVSLDKLEALFPLPELPELSDLQLCLRAPSQPHFYPKFSCHPPSFPAFPKLTALSIQSYDPLPPSLSNPFFSSLPTFPRLQKLSLSTPISPPFLGDPISIRRFVSRHEDTLKALSLRGNDLSSTIAVSHSSACNAAAEYNKFRLSLGLGPYSSHSYYSLSSWIQEALCDSRYSFTSTPTHLPALNFLEINLTLIPFSSSLALIRTFGRTLLSLTLNGSGSGTASGSGLYSYTETGGGCSLTRGVVSGSGLGLGFGLGKEDLTAVVDALNGVGVGVAAHSRSSSDISSLSTMSYAMASCPDFFLADLDMGMDLDPNSIGMGRMYMRSSFDSASPSALTAEKEKETMSMSLSSKYHYTHHHRNQCHATPDRYREPVLSPSSSPVPRPPPPLLSLTLPLHTLSPAIFDLLASSLPSLKNLELRVREVVPEEGDGVVVWNGFGFEGFDGFGSGKFGDFGGFGGFDDIRHGYGPDDDYGSDQKAGSDETSWLEEKRAKGKDEGICAVKEVDASAESDYGEEEDPNREMTFIEALEDDEMSSRRPSYEQRQMHSLRQFQDEDQLDRFLDTMHTRSYTHWDLRRLVLVFPFPSSFGSRRVFDFDFDLTGRARARGKIDRLFRARRRDGDEVNDKWRRTFEKCFLGVDI